MIFQTLLFFSVFYIQAVAAQSQSTYISPGGNHCLPCDKGNKVVTHCTQDLTRSSCIPCDQHHYSDEPNNKTYCTQCKPGCPQNGFAVQNCTTTSNLVCICLDGFHKFPLDHIDPHWECKQHAKCMEGQGVEYQGNFTHDTKCQECSSDEQLNTTDPDHPWCQKLAGTNETDADRGFNITTSAGSPTTSSTNPGETSDNGLGAGKIAAIICGVILPIIIIIIAVLYIKRRRCRSKMKTAENGGPHQKSNEELTPMVSSGRTENDPDLGSESPNVQLAGQWTENFIAQRVFSELSHRGLGQEWKNFIRTLPGWDMSSATTTIDHAIEEEFQVSERIMKCLNKWKEQCSSECTGPNILQALKRIGRADLIPRLLNLQFHQ